MEQQATTEQHARMSEGKNSLNPTQKKSSLSQQTTARRALEPFKSTRARSHIIQGSRVTTSASKKRRFNAGNLATSLL